MDSLTTMFLDYASEHPSETLALDAMTNGTQYGSLVGSAASISVLVYKYKFPTHQVKLKTSENMMINVFTAVGAKFYETIFDSKMIGNFIRYASTKFKDHHSRDRSWQNLGPRLRVSSTIFGAAASFFAMNYDNLNNNLDEIAIREKASFILNDEEAFRLNRYSLTGFACGFIGGALIGRNRFSHGCSGIAMGFAFYQTEKKFNLREMYQSK